MTAKRTACPRCGTPHVLDGGRCVRCRQDSERALELAEAMRQVGRALVWVEAEAWFRANEREGRAAIATVLLVHRRAA